MPKKPAQSASTEQTASFESALGELESIVTRLESGELPLEDALNEFERGVQLARQGQQKLQQAEQRVQILLNDSADDAALSGDVLVEKLLPLKDPDARATMRAALEDTGAGSVAEDLAARIAAAAGKDT